MVIKEGAEVTRDIIIPINGAMKIVGLRVISKDFKPWIMEIIKAILRVIIKAVAGVVVVGVVVEVVAEGVNISFFKRKKRINNIKLSF